MKKLEARQILLQKYRTELYVLLFAFGGACSKRQLLCLDDFSEGIIKELVSHNILKSVIIDRRAFIICKNAVYKYFGIKQNYRLSAYTIKKSCLLAEYWLLCHHCAESIFQTIGKGNLHQYEPLEYSPYISYLHTQGCYIRFLTDNPKTVHFVYFPKSANPKTIAIFIKNFYNCVSDGTAEYKLSVRLHSKEQKSKILKHIDGRYWYILENLHFFELNCTDTVNII